ncbi:MAG: GNAT family N-acetyltransferase, partial [bacterium]
IAVNEKDEVLGFRGYFIIKFTVKSKDVLIAQLSDTVVSKNVRRMGIFQKMTNYSIKYLTENNISFILNLSPSWPPYHGYKKMEFEDLANFHSKYKFNFINILKEKVLKKDRSHWKNHKNIEKNIKSHKYTIASNITKDILSQLTSLNKSNALHSSLTTANLLWRTQRPNTIYIYAYALNNKGALITFLMFKSSNFYHYNLGLTLTNNTSTIKPLMKLFRKTCKPSVIAAWDFATNATDRAVLKKIGMYTIPFINKIRKNPPGLVRTLQKHEDGKLNWIINGIDIRDVNNWSISKFDLDSF